MKNLHILILFTLFSVACKRQHLQKTTPEATKDSLLVVVPTPTVPEAPKVPPVVEEKVPIEEIDFQYIASKSKVSFKSKDQKFDDLTVNIRMKKDSVIWFSVRMMIEVARGIITKEGLTLMDMYHKDYYKFGYDSLSTKFGAKLDFNLIQSIVVGNMPLQKKPREVRKEKEYFLLKQEEGRVIVDNYIGEQNKKLKKLLVQDQPTKTSLRMEYDDFQLLNNLLFPYTNLITIDGTSQKDNLPYQTVLQIKHQKVEVPAEALTFPFVIPASYTRK